MSANPGSTGRPVLERAPRALAGGAPGVPGDTTVRRPAATQPILRASITLNQDDMLPNLVGSDPVWHLLRRTTFGPTPDLVAEVRSQGMQAWLDDQLNPASIDDSVCDAYLTRYPSLSMSTSQIRAAYPRVSWEPMYELGRATLARALWSTRQLFEVMVEFWSNHFNVTTPSGEVSDLKSDEDREVIRRNALGKFSELLIASARSPAMIRFLDNSSSTGQALNENYGRELLELHTVGIDAHYTHQEVIDSARIVAGFAVSNSGEFVYRDDWRYVGTVSVLGFTSSNESVLDGISVAEQYLNYLARHPLTAQHLATKLAIRFVSDSPSSSLISQLAQTYLRNDTSIVPVLKTLFASNEFAKSIGQKTKRPLEDFIGTARILGVAPDSGDSKSLNGCYWALSGLGQAPLDWGPPDGYPDSAAAWMSSSGTLGRWNIHIGMLQGRWKDGMRASTPASLLGGNTPGNLEALIDLLSLRLIGTRLGEQQRAAIISFVLASGAPRVQDAINWRLDAICALVLNSPAWVQR